jgi:hypothetical protein
MTHTLKRHTRWIVSPNLLTHGQTFQYQKRVGYARWASHSLAQLFCSRGGLLCVTHPHRQSQKSDDDGIRRQPDGSQPDTTRASLNLLLVPDSLTLALE